MTTLVTRDQMRPGRMRERAAERQSDRKARQP